MVLFDVFVEDDGWLLAILCNGNQTLLMARRKALESSSVAHDVVFGVRC